ncbi:MAG: hypothetical protein QXN71_01130 [Candidatus Aenigmatarchaeota archaeon]
MQAYAHKIKNYVSAILTLIAFLSLVSSFSVVNKGFAPDCTGIGRLLYVHDL